MVISGKGLLIGLCRYPDWMLSSLQHRPDLTSKVAEGCGKTLAEIIYRRFKRFQICLDRFQWNKGLLEFIKCIYTLQLTQSSG